MNVLFLEVGDLKNSEYEREGNKNLLKTEFGTGDTVALCGRIDNIKNTRYGPRLWINDGEVIQITVGTFNKNVRRDAEKILERFNKSKEKEFYALVYGNPYETDQLYINVNHDNGVILVDKEIYGEFHELRKQSRDYLMNKLASSSEKREGISNSEILRFVKEKDTGNGVKVSDILKHFDEISKDIIEEKIFELMENGELYEPKPRLLKMIE